MSVIDINSERNEHNFGMIRVRSVKGNSEV